MLQLQLLWRCKMVLGFGDDFRAARRGWLYEVRPGQKWWVVWLLAIVAMALLFFLQNVAAVVIMGGMVAAGDTAAAAALRDMQATGVVSVDFLAVFAKAMVLGTAPVGALAALIAWWFAGFGHPNKSGRLPLAVPSLGVLGWVVLLVGFAIAISVIFSGTFYVLGIDPKTYQPSSEGMKDVLSQSGIVEKTMAGLVKEPLLFALAFPGIAIFSPLVEEFVFRGALFNWIAGSWFGKVGAVVITSALWSVIHGMSAPWLFVFIIFLMGLLLGVLLLRFGSLWVTIACHAVWNTLTVISIFNISGAQ